MSTLKEQREENGIREKSQLDLFIKYERQERKKAGIVNFHDHYEDISGMLFKWMDNPKLKESGRKAFGSIYFKLAMMYSDLLNHETINNPHNIDFYSNLCYEMEKKNKELSSKLRTKNIEALKLEGRIKELEKVNSENEDILYMVWGIEK